VSRSPAGAATLDPGSPSAPTDLIDSLLESSRVWVALAARALGARDDEVTLRQFRVLVVLGAQGPLRLVDLARSLFIDASTASRLCDQLVKKRLIVRRTNPSSRREVQIGLSAKGARFLDAVNEHRRADIQGILRQLPPGAGERLLSALREFSRAFESAELAGAGPTSA
jgi:DNA-binding MarR family transcriptional regulator